MGSRDDPIAMLSVCRCYQDGHRNIHLKIKIFLKNARMKLKIFYCRLMTLTFLIWSKVLELKMLNFVQVFHKFDVWQLICQLEKM